MSVPMITRSFAANGRVERYEVPAISPADMVRHAIRYLNVVADGTYERWVADMEEANRFATFCVSETVLHDTPDWCDPTRSFRDLWTAFLEADTNQEVSQ